MKKKRSIVLGIILLICLLVNGCSKTSNEQIAYDTESVLEIEETEIDTGIEAKLPDGVYSVAFDTDSSMFRVNEAYDGKGTLTVENGEMTIHISLGSKNIVNLYVGLAEDAKKEGAELLYPTVDTVTYSDGWVSDVFGFDIPVPKLDEEFDVALIGKKGKWYDHKVIVSNPEPLQEKESTIFDTKLLDDGSYTVELIFEGGSGRAAVLSPAVVDVSHGVVTATIQWSSPNYDYMLVDEEKYLPINTEGNSVFKIPVSVFDKPLKVIGDTVAMSTPHEIEYSITFCSDTLKLVE